MCIDDELQKNAHEILKECTGCLSAEDQLQQDLDLFNSSPLMDKSAVAYADRFCERGASYAMPHKVYCKKVGRSVYFLDYSVCGEDKDICIEGQPGVPKCPYARKKECDKYKQFPFGKKKTVSIRIKK